MTAPVIHSQPDAFGVYCITTLPKHGPWHPDTKLTDAEFAAACDIVDYRDDEAEFHRRRWASGGGA